MRSCLATNKGRRMIVLMCVLIHRSEKWKWVFDNVQLARLPGGRMNWGVILWDSSLSSELQLIKWVFTGISTKKKHFYRWHLAANSLPANCQLLADPLWKHCGGFTLLFLNNTNELQRHDAGVIGGVIVQRRINSFVLKSRPPLFNCVDFTSAKCSFYSYRENCAVNGGHY